MEVLFPSGSLRDFCSSNLDQQRGRVFHASTVDRDRRGPAVEKSLLPKCEGCHRSYENVGSSITGKIRRITSG
jgi:hypothetical protein